MFEIITPSGYKIPSKVIDLLMEIEKTGSLNAAVKNLDMSYSYAWNMIFKANCQLGQPLIISRKGGNGGGVAELTNTAKALLIQYRKFEAQFVEFLKEHRINLKPDQPMGMAV